MWSGSQKKRRTRNDGMGRDSAFTGRAVKGVRAGTMPVLWIQDGRAVPSRTVRKVGLPRLAWRRPARLLPDMLSDVEGGVIPRRRWDIKPDLCGVCKRRPGIRELVRWWNDVLHRCLACRYCIRIAGFALGDLSCGQALEAGSRPIRWERIGTSVGAPHPIKYLDSGRPIEEIQAHLPRERVKSLLVPAGRRVTEFFRSRKKAAKAAAEGIQENDQ